MTNMRSLVVPARFLQAVVVLVGAGALAFLLGEPHLEGRNAHAAVVEIYFKDPFLAFAYLGSIPFFVALHRSYKMFGFIGRNEAFSPSTVKAFGTIKWCALALIGFVALGEVFIFLGDSDDRAGGVFMGVLIASGAAVMAAAAARFETICRNAAKGAATEERT